MFSRAGEEEDTVQGSDGLKAEFQGLWQAVVRLWIGGSGHGEKGRAKQGRCNFVWCVCVLRYCAEPGGWA